MNKVKKHFSTVAKIKSLHGSWAVFLLYLTKIPLIKNLLKNTTVKTKILGNIMHLNITDGGLHRKLILKGIREEAHTRQIQNNVKKGMIGIDLGANIGYFALLEARLVGDTGKIYCIEPEPKNVRLLHKNIEENNLGNIMSVYGFLIGDHISIEKLYLSEFGNVHSLSSVRNKKGFIEVPMITLDEFIINNELDPKDIDFIRMDIEGYEVMAFQGMENLFRSNSKLKIFMEFHPAYYSEWGWTFERLLRYLESFGFKVAEFTINKEVFNKPTVEEILEIQKKSPSHGGQALLERLAQ